MIEIKIEINSCSTCPCLRNDEYGFHCFYNKYHSLATYLIDEIDPQCPFIGHDSDS